MESDVVAQFTEITGSSPELATQYLQLTDFNIEQAMQLYFENGGAPLTEEPRQPSRPSNFEDESGVVHIDSDSDADDRTERSTQPAGGATFEDDAAMARRLQEEMYGGGGAGGGQDTGRGNDDFDDEGVRAPMARTTETLVGPEADFDDGDMHANILGQLRARQRGGSYSIIDPCDLNIWFGTNVIRPARYLQPKRHGIDMDRRSRGSPPRAALQSDWGRIRCVFQTELTCRNVPPPI